MIDPIHAKIIKKIATLIKILSIKLTIQNLDILKLLQKIAVLNLKLKIL